ncbi:LutC/YkgG family protein [Saccharopolyspora cebuensis]|uniref:Lactate utilization protein C n=1 Tax=Saccharopolyspora cebuensis TaxID=418759 RepID=A0ABV4C9X4_9PSEU
MNAREAVLRRVREALAGTERTPRADIPRDYATSRDVADPVALFCERVADYRAEIERIGPEDLPGRITTALGGAERVLTPSGLPQAWYPPAGSFELLSDGDELSAAELDRVDAVVTTAVVGIASTGTIVLDHGPGQGRRAVTLVPDVHVCVLRESQIVDDVPAALHRLDPARPLTFISGPSATSDIELKRVEGVHGPRTLRVLVLP